MTNQSLIEPFPADDFLNPLEEMRVNFSVTNSENKQFAFNHSYPFGTRWVEILTDIAGVLDSAGYAGAKERMIAYDDQLFRELDNKIAPPCNT